MSAEDLLQRLHGVRKRGKGRWFAQCPIHTEKTGSVSITEMSDGRLLAYCFGCGAKFPEICKAVGYEYKKDGWIPDPNRWNTPNKFEVREVVKAFKDELAVAWVLLSDVSAGKVMSKQDRQRAATCARRCIAMMEELS